jgi:hypothetical protein
LAGVGVVGVVHGSTVLKNVFQSSAKEETSSSSGEAEGSKATEGGESKSTTPAGKSSSGQNINAYGEKLGPTNQPQRHGTNFSTRKAAKDAARERGKSTPIQDKGHFHATDKSGKKLKNAGHFNFPE